MSSVEKLLKSPSLATPHPATSTDESAVAVEPSVNGYDSRLSNNEATISKVVQEVVRSICHSEWFSKSVDELRDDGPLLNSTSKSVEDCVESVVQSNFIDRRLAKSMSLAANVPDAGDQLAAAEAMESGQQATEDLEPPPTLTAVMSNFDQYRYRKRRKRRLFSRRPSRRYPMKLNAASNGIDGVEPPLRRRPKQIAEQDKGSIRVTNVEYKLSHMAAQVHNSVFSPDQCGLTKSSKQRRRNHENPDSARSLVSLCWHYSLNEKLFPHLHAFKSEELSEASTWSVDKVSDFVKALPACPPMVAEKFRQEQIDGEAFLLLTQHDIVQLMNIRLGPAVKIHNAIMFLKHKKLNGNQKRSH